MNRSSHEHQDEGSDTLRREKSELKSEVHNYALPSLSF